MTRLHRAFATRRRAAVPVGAALLAALSLAALAPRAGATQITLDAVVGTWVESGEAGISWGVPVTASGPSAYEFEASAAPDHGAYASGAIIPLGEVRHLNFPVISPDFTGGRLELAITGRLGGDAPGAAPDSPFAIATWLEFEHDETVNQLATCPYGGAQGVGVNMNGCADRMRLMASGPELFRLSHGDADHRFALLGFEALAAGLVTPEMMASAAPLSGRLDLASSVSSVPAPAALPMTLASIAVFGLLRRARARPRRDAA